MLSKPARSKVCVIAASAALAALIPNAFAQLYVYEGFNYTTGSDILGQGTGTGFSGNWRIHTGGAVPAGSFTAVSGSLTAPVGLPTSGGHALLTGEFGTLQPARDFANIAGTAGTTTWISFIGQRQGAPVVPPTDGTNQYGRGVTVSVFDTELSAGGTAERVGVGNSTGALQNEWSVISQGNSNQRVGGELPFNLMAWAVLRIDHLGDATVQDNAYLWLNPDPLGAEPLIVNADAQVIGAFDYSNLDFIRPFVGNTAGGRPFGVLVFDELRIGGDWAAMSAVPEPSVLTLAGLGALALLRRRFKS
jgi:hypothetical protein